MTKKKRIFFTYAKPAMGFLKLKLRLVTFVILFSLNCMAQSSYKNPIIPADYSDPDVIRVGEDYYLTSSSFNVVPGLPILHSKNLVDWTIIGHAVKELPDALYTYKNRKENQLDYDIPRLGKGVFAPCIRFHEGFFWIFWGDPDAGVYMVKAKNPAGPWSKPHLVKKAQGWIDTTPLWDPATGKAWLAHAYAKSRAGIHSKVAVNEMSWDGTELCSDEVIVFDAADRVKYPADREHRIIEGCKFMKKNGFYYIHCPAGGVPQGWQTSLRSKNPLGPYEIRVVCETGNTKVNGPHQGALIDTPSGEWWFAHFQSVNVLGRIVWLQPVKWVDNWPLIGSDDNNDGIGNPVLEYPVPASNYNGEKFRIQTSDEFDGNKIGLQWQWPANTGSSYCKLKQGQLIIKPFESDRMKLIEAPNVINQMFPDFKFSATAKVKLTGNGKKTIQGGLAVMGRKCFSIGLEKKSEGTYLTVTNSDETDTTLQVYTDELILKLEADGELPLPFTPNGKENNGNVKCRFFYSTNGTDFTPLGKPFYAREGVWIGARLGLYCLSQGKSNGALNADWFRIE